MVKVDLLLIDFIQFFSDQNIKISGVYFTRDLSYAHSFSKMAAFKNKSNEYFVICCVIPGFFFFFPLSLSYF